MSLLKYAAAFLIAASCSFAEAGDFKVTGADASSVSVHYSGYVERLDVRQWHIISEVAGDRVIILTIDSGGGSAYGGLELYWALEAHPRLVTRAGSQVGAWSAAAIMWLAGDHQLIAENGAVWFHAAYCSWGPDPMPDIGCDTTEFQYHLIRVLSNAGYHGATFNTVLNYVQMTHGTDGWIGVTHDGWQMFDSTDWWFTPFNKELLI